MKKLLITDVDNTLLDWQALWFETFTAMAKEALSISNVDPARFYSECSIIHQRYGTSEYSFLLDELPCLREIYGNDVRTAMEPAIKKYREVRARHLVLYPEVLSTLNSLKASGVKIAAFTESKAFYTSYRFRTLGLDGLVDVLYSPRDHAIPLGASDRRDDETSFQQLKLTKHLFIPDGEEKPNPHILLSIIDELGFRKEEAVYIGDNKYKDIYMAKKAGVLDVYAAYGSAQHRVEQYDLLKKVTHWTPEMVAREAEHFRPGVIEPTFTLVHSFSEITSVVMGTHE